MEKNINLNDIKLYKDSRDNFLKAISVDICKICTDPQKAKMKIDYVNPLNCECRCERVENLLITVSNLDVEINTFTSNN